MKVGLTLNPDTPVDAILNYGNQIDLALIMTVYPWKGGQSFIERVMEKVKTIWAKYPNLDIEVDGGLKPKIVDMAGLVRIWLYLARVNMFQSCSALSKNIETEKKTCLNLVTDAEQMISVGATDFMNALKKQNTWRYF